MWVTCPICGKAPNEKCVFFFEPRGYGGEGGLSVRGLCFAVWLGATRASDPHYAFAGLEYYGDPLLLTGVI